MSVGVAVTLVTLLVLTARRRGDSETA
jgi:hypothetical protein